MQECGEAFQDAHDSAVGEYKFELHTEPDDPNAQDFIAWAYTHYTPYRSAYQLCEDYEGTYKALLATIVAETPAVSARATKTSTSSSRRPTVQSREATRAPVVEVILIQEAPPGPALLGRLCSS